MNLFYILYIFTICPGCFPGQHSVTHDQAATVSEMDPIPGAWRTGEYFPLLAGKRVACVVNQTSLIGNVHLVDSMLGAGILVQKVLAPEHGFRGKADAGGYISDETDPDTGLEIVSLYGKKKKPLPEDLAGIEVVVFDIQDVGIRFYTYISTLHLVMEACAEMGIPVLLLDRPNPHGYYVDGPVLQLAYRSFVGMHAVPVVYGMTIGEYGLMINAEHWLAGGVQCALQVIPCLRYDHTMTYALPVPPSPNLPNARAVLLYPSLCFFEGTQVSVGRGTEKQFQVIGHPEYAGPLSFTPEPRPGATHPMHEGIPLRGDDLSRIPVEEILSWKQLNLSWLISYHQVLHPAGKFYLNPPDFFDKLAGGEMLRHQLDAGLGEAEIRASWQPGIEHFLGIRKQYLLYPDFTTTN